MSDPCRYKMFLRKYPWMPVALLDGAILVGLLVGKWVIEILYNIGRPCSWTRVGAQCATCGGTHCVESFLQGDFAEAFSRNQMVFCWILYGIVTVVLLNLQYFCKQTWAGKALHSMYSLRAFFVALAVYLAFAVLRNLPLLIQLFS